MAKLFYFMVLCTSFAFLACNNDIATSQVPSLVRNSFKSTFIQADNTRWKFVNRNYEVSFKLENDDYNALLDSSGNLIKYKYAIEGIAVPKKLIAFLQQKYPKGNLDAAEYIIDGKSKYFQLEVGGFFTDKNLVIDSVGKLLPNIKYWK